MTRSQLFIALVAIVTVAGIAAPAAAQCPDYGCEAALIPLASGALVLQGSTRYPTTWYERPPTDVAMVFADGAVVLEIPLQWQRLSYSCCCPTEWYAEFADVVNGIVHEGTRLDVVIGYPSVCVTSVFASVGNQRGTRGTRQELPILGSGQRSRGGDLILDGDGNLSAGLRSVVVAGPTTIGANPASEQNGPVLSQPFVGSGEEVEGLPEDPDAP